MKATIIRYNKQENQMEKLSEVDLGSKTMEEVMQFAATVPNGQIVVVDGKNFRMRIDRGRFYGGIYTKSKNK